MTSPHTVLIVEDFQPDRELYRRCLLADANQVYLLLEAESTQAGLELCRTESIDLILLDYRLPDGDGLSFLADLRSQQIGEMPPVIVVTGQGDEAIAVQAMKLGAEDYLVKYQLTPERLQVTVRMALENARLRWQLRQSQAELREATERERIVHQITQQIRRSLNPTEVLNAAVTEVRQFLSADRAFIYRFYPDFSGKIVVESLAAGLAAAIGAEVEDTYFMDTLGEDYRQGRIQVVEDIETAGLTDCHREMLARFAIRANLVIPILQGQSLWGLLVVSQGQPRVWRSLDINLTQQLAAQIGIAIQQAELYQQLQIELLDRQQAEVRLQESQNRLQLALDGGQQGTWDLDLATRWAYWSPRCKALFGLEPDDAWVSVEQFFALLHPDDRDRVRAVFESALESRGLYTTDYRVVWQDGSVHWIHVKARVRVDDRGQPTQVTGIVMDVSDRKQLEAALQENQQRLQLAIDGTGMATWDFDLQQQRVICSEGHFRLLGYDPEVTSEMTLELCQSRVHPDDRDRLLAAIDHARITRSIYSPVHRIIRADTGEVRWIQVFGRFLYNEAGAAIRSMGVFFDVTERKQMELELAQSHDRFELAAAAVNSIIYDWDLQTDRVERTRGLYEVTGYRPEEAEPTAAWWFNLMHPDDRAKKTRERVLTELAQLDRYCNEYRVRHKDGHYIWVEDWAQVLKDADGQPIRIVGNSRDISDRRRAEQQVRESEERLLLGVQVAGVGIARVDYAQNRVELSPEAAEMFGISLDQRVVTREDIHATFHPEEQEMMAAIIRQVIDPAGNGWFAREHRVVWQTGEVRWLSVRKQVFFDRSGAVHRPDYAILAAIDVTDRKRREQNLRESEERLQLGVQVAGVALARFDYATHLVQLSPEAAAMYGLPPDQLTVTRAQVHATFHPDERDLMERIIQGVLDPAGNGWFAREHRVVWQTGEVRWLSVRKQVFFDRSGAVHRPDYAILAAIDVTDRKRVEIDRATLLAAAEAARAEAEAANRSKDEFVAIVAHELRSPLNSILGWAQLLRTRQFDTDTLHRALETIERNTLAQVQLVEDLLDISRMVRGTLHLNLTMVNVSNVIEAALDLVRPQTQAKSLNLTFSRCDRACFVSGDFNRLQQIIVNLLTNAIKFTPERGQIEIQLEQIAIERCTAEIFTAETQRAQREEEERGEGELGVGCSEVNLPPALHPPLPTLHSSYIQIRVVDTGKGIAPEFLSRIFDRFQQGQRNTGAKDGLGLGLAIVKNLVELHQGRVTVESPGVGLGATFTVRLPSLNPVERVAIRQDVAIAAERGSLVGVRVLVVDDDPDMLELLRYLLEESRAEVRSAQSVAAALALLPEFQPQLLISDLAMPEGSGYDLVQQMRSLPGGQIPAIALTAYASTSYTERSLQAGFQEHLTKPVDAEALLAAMLRLLSGGNGGSGNAGSGNGGGED